MCVTMVTNINPHLQVKWYKDQVQVSKLDYLEIVQVNNGSVLKIFKSKSYMSGNYECKGWNKYGNDSKSFSLNVEGILATCLFSMCI